jgi:hypothetical protein
VQLTDAKANTAGAVPCDVNSVHFIVLFTQKQNVGLPLEHDVISYRVGRHFVRAQTAAAAELTRMLSCGPERKDESASPEAVATPYCS